MVQEAVVITESNVFNQVIANVYSILNNRSNVPDPADSTGKRKFVYVREPQLGRNFAGFPFIVVSHEDYSQGNKNADATKAFTRDTISIIVMTQDDNSDNSGNPSGAAQLDEISSNILKTLNDKTNSATLRNNGLRNKEFTSADFEWGEIEGKRIFRREFTLQFSGLRKIAI